MAWINFYMLTGTAAATLVGLMFIAVTFGSKLVTPETTMRTRIFLSPIIYHFLQVFLVSCMALIPVDGAAYMGITAVVSALLRLLTMPIMIRQLLREDADSEIGLSDWILSMALPSLLYLLLGASGIAFTQNVAWGAEGIAAAVIGLLALGIFTAWDMLIWIASKV